MLAERRSFLTSFFCIAAISPAQAGNLNACDLARVGARGAVLSAYAPILSKLDAVAATAKPDAAGTLQATYTDRGGNARSFQPRALTAELQQQKAADLAQADKAAGASCGGSEDPDAVARDAAALADRSVAAALARHLPDADATVLGRF